MEEIESDLLRQKTKYFKTTPTIDKKMIGA